MTDPIDKVEAFLSANPGLEVVEAVLPDMAGGHINEGECAITV